MSNKVSNPFDLTETQLQELLNFSYSPFPELQKALTNTNELAEMKQTKIALETAKELVVTLKDIPILTDSLYRSFAETGEREPYLKPHDVRRKKLSIATLLFILGYSDLKTIIESYLLAICEERTWVVPPHEGRLIDLYAADTALTLADVLSTAGKHLDTRVVQRVEQEIEKRIFDPYLNRTLEHKWYKNSDNWNAVCNSQIAVTFLFLEKNQARKVHAIKTALDSLRVYIDTAFNKDGGTSEGINYWHYGISWFVIFSEMLRDLSNGQIDLLSIERIKDIAAYPGKIQLGSRVFASFSDVDVDELSFNAGVVQRLAKRTSEKSLLGLIVEPVEPDYHGLTSMLRFILWWDGKTYKTLSLEDSILPDSGIVRLVSEMPDKAPVALAIKAGHNGENHNHNDVGSFIVNVAGENFITDPGAGLYNKDYLGDKRYENIFANSYGHSVPRIDKKLQSAGENFFGKLLGVEHNEKIKKAVIEFAKSYDIHGVIAAKRSLMLSNQPGGGDLIVLEDEFEFSEKLLEIEEAFVTWIDVEVNGRQAVIHGKYHDLSLVIEEPASSEFQLEKLEKQSEQNKKRGILKRISVTVPFGNSKKILFRMTIS